MKSLLKLFMLVALLGLRLVAGEIAMPIGIVGANQDAFFDLVYRNGTANPVPIRQIKSSCDCVTVLTYPDTVAAGSEARITCVYRSAAPGNIRIEVEIFGTDPVQPVAAFYVTGFVAEKSWLVSAQDVLGDSPDKALLVDVRSAEDFSRAHAAHALNLPAFSLKTREALKSRRLVLIDDGFAPETLLAEVLTLHKQGFPQVAVLTGGLAAWVRAGGAVEGEKKAARQMALISAAQFERSQAVNPWLSVSVGTGGKAVKHSIPVLRVGDVQELRQKLSVWTSPVSGGLGFQPVLVLTSDAQIQAAIERQLGHSNQIYYLAGGEKALEAQQAVQIALASHTDQTFTSQPVTSHSTARPVVSGHCGSCGK